MVKRHKWINGILESYNHIFESLEDAQAFAVGADADTIKIYDANGQLVQESTPAQNSYA
jgi:hypothetical protein